MKYVFILLFAVMSFIKSINAQNSNTYLKSGVKMTFIIFWVDLLIITILMGLERLTTIQKIGEAF